MDIREDTSLDAAVLQVWKMQKQGIFIATIEEEDPDCRISHRRGFKAIAGGAPNALLPGENQQRWEEKSRMVGGKFDVSRCAGTGICAGDVESVVLLENSAPGEEKRKVENRDSGGWSRPRCSNSAIGPE
ncbi:hypothetical protein KM043_001164 [Ampulex compressa]|nr:hypothetical protein KM043_001164 [Ampulex compressa]